MEGFDAGTHSITGCNNIVNEQDMFAVEIFRMRNRKETVRIGAPVFFFERCLMGIIS